MKAESLTQRLILDWLAAEHIFALRLNVLAVKMDDRFVRAGVPGMADILAFPQIKISGVIATVLTPLPVWIECKSSTGKQSALQKSFQAKVESEGHKYIVARDLESVQAALGR